MGKRRSLKPGGKDEPSDDEDDYEETQEPLKPEQIEEIQSRKKLTAKRRVVDSTKTSEANPFTGFGGFKGFGSAAAATPTPSQNGINKSDFTASKLTTTEPAQKFSLLSKIEEKKPLLPFIGETEKKDTNTSKAQNNDESNINEIEVNFIVELNKLYEKYYGSSKREYKLPSHLIDKNETNKTNYAHLLMELNKRCSKWISKHVEESPFVYLTPIFVDYFNYLILLEKEFFPSTTLFTTNGVHKTVLNTISTVSSVTATPSNITFTPFNGGATTQTPALTKLTNSDISITPVHTLTSASATIQTQKPSEEVSVSMKFPTAVNQFKFSPIPLTISNNETKPIETTKTSSLFDSSNKKTDFVLSNQEKPSLVTPAPAPIKFTASETSASPAITPFSSYKPLTTTPTPVTTATTTPFSSLTQPSSSLSGSPKIGMFGSFAATATTAASTATASASTTASTTTSFFGKPSGTSFFSLNKKEETTQETKTTSVGLPFMTPSTDLNKEITFPKPTTATSPQTTGTTNLFSSLSKPATAATTISTTPATNTTTTNFFSNMLSNQKPSDPSKPFSFGNLPTTSSIFGGATSFGFQSSTSIFSTTASSAPAQEGEEGEGGDDENYQPPKPEVKEIVEEGALYSKRTKLYYLNSENTYADRGIGNLHIKKTSSGSKKQLVIRADTNLGNILLNVALTKQIPISKEGKNSVSILCVPNPPIPKTDEKKPCKFLIKVKTEEDATELFNKLQEMRE